jgi:hypothetical protein
MVLSAFFHFQSFLFFSVLITTWSIHRTKSFNHLIDVIQIYSSHSVYPIAVFARTRSSVFSLLSMLIRTPTAIKTVSWISLQCRSMVDLCQYSFQGMMWWRFYPKFKTLLITKNLRQLKLHPSIRLPVGICAEFYWAVIFSLPKLGPRFKICRCRIWLTGNYSQRQSAVYSSELISINTGVASPPEECFSSNLFWTGWDSSSSLSFFWSKDLYFVPQWQGRFAPILTTYVCLLQFSVVSQWRCNLNLPIT